MSDAADRAQGLTEQQLADALSDHFRNNPPRAETRGLPAPHEGGRGEVICIECEEAIDPRRLAAHPAAIRCIDCQEEFERRPIR